MREPEFMEPAEPLRGRCVVVGICGGIAAYKVAELVRGLSKAGADVWVVMTEGATHFVGPLTFQTITGHPVLTDLFSLTQESEIGHIQVADRADLLLVAPATANTIGRLAAGLADDALTAVALATRAPILLAPSMNVNMWENPITRDNLRRLTEVRGARVVGPGAGFLACRWIGPGRMAEPADILEAAARVLTPQDLTDARVVVSAGPTREPLDPVRFLSNRSTGKMGYALAAAAARRGAEVILVSGPTHLEPPPGVDVRPVGDAREMDAAVRAAWDSADVVIMSAAVSDFRPDERSEQKIKKRALGGDAPGIALARNPDILAGLGARRAETGDRRPVLVGFAAETENVVDNARAKLADKRCDLVVANDVSRPDAGFETDTTEVVLVEDGGERRVPAGTKSAVAHRVLDRIVELLA